MSQLCCDCKYRRYSKSNFHYYCDKRKVNVPLNMWICEYYKPKTNPLLKDIIEEKEYYEQIKGLAKNWKLWTVIFVVVLAVIVIALYGR